MTSTGFYQRRETIKMLTVEKEIKAPGDHQDNMLPEPEKTESANNKNDIVHMFDEYHN